MADAQIEFLSHGLDLISRRVLSNVSTLDAETLELLNDTIPSDILEKALDIAERGAVSCIVGAPSGHRMFRVRGTASEPYTCLPLTYCSCPDFFQRSFGSHGGGGGGRSGAAAAAARRRLGGDRARRAEQQQQQQQQGPGPSSLAAASAVPTGGGFLFCKHIVAVHVAQAAGLCAEHSVSDGALGEMLCSAPTLGRS